MARTGVFTKLYNILSQQINPATEDKQDDIITELQKLVGFEIPAYDYVERGWTAGTFTEVWSFYSGGSGGTLVATITIVYDDVDMSNIISVTKT